MQGLCTVATGADLRVESYGGGVYVSGDLHVDGALEVHQSHSGRGGGGVYVTSALAQGGRGGGRWSVAHACLWVR